MWNRTEILDDIDGALISLDTVDPEADQSDLDPIESLFVDRAIIALGESTHGTREFYRAKHRLLRFLVAELGVQTVGLEAGFEETFALNKYVLRGEGDPTDILTDLGWHVATEEVLEAVEWLREFNDGKPRSRQVTCYGFDMGSGRGSIRAVEEYLWRVDPSFHDEYGAEFAELASFRDWNEDGRNERLRAARNVQSVVEERLLGFKAEYVAESSRRAWDLAKHHLDVFGHAREYALLGAKGEWVRSREHRDRSMADNVDWILDHENADLIVLWAHNSHIRNGRVESSMPDPATTMGWHLSRRYGDDYYALGLAFGRGIFQAYPNPESENEAGLQEFSLDAPRKGSVPDLFGGVDDQLFLLDLDRAIETDRLGGWIENDQEILSIGAFYYENDLERHYNHSPLEREFDGLLFVEESTRTSPLS